MPMLTTPKAALAAAALALLAGPALASPVTVSTQFNTSEGFVTGDFGDQTISNGPLSVTFSGGQQQQSFNLAAYNVNPAAYLWINGTLVDSVGPNAGTNSVSGDGIDDDLGLIDFNIGVSEVSFFAANIANGAAAALTFFGVDDVSVLGTILISQESNQLSDGATPTVITSSVFAGQEIGSIGVNLPGPASPPNPPYALAIDSFSATAAVPEPTTLATLALGSVGMAGLRYRRRKRA